MSWRDGEATPEEGVAEASEEQSDPIKIARDAARPATILRVAGELEERGGKILELFKEIESPLGRVVLPIYLRQDDRDFFVEVATGPWDDRKSGEALDKAAILRSSEHAEAGLEILSGYPVPSDVEFFFGTSPAALLQLDLARLTPDRPEVCAGLFREVGSNHWGVDLDYEPGYLPLVEELLIAALEGDEAQDSPAALQRARGRARMLSGRDHPPQRQPTRCMVPTRGVGRRTHRRDRGVRTRPRRQSQGFPRIRAGGVAGFLRRVRTRTMGRGMRSPREAQA